MPKRERSPFGTRLEEAIKLPGRPGSIRRFQKVLEKRYSDRERFGYSYPTINAYLQPDGPSPNIEWAREVASLLRVRTSWLAFGEGSILEAHHDSAPWIHHLRQKAESGVYNPLAAIMGGGASAELFKDLLNRIVDARPPEDSEPTELQLNALVLRIWLSLEGLRTALGKGPGASDAEVRRVFVVILTALIQVVPGPGEGRSIEHVTNRLRPQSTRRPAHEEG